MPRASVQLASWETPQIHGSAQDIRKGVTMFFAIKEALLNVTKTMNPHPEQQLNTE